MNIQPYKSFLTVVQCKSFTLAAKALNFSQPTISNHIANLEEIYGVTLFAREGKSIYLTQAGNTFVPIAEKLVASFEAGLEEMRALQEEGDSLRIAVSTQFINLYLIQILNKVKERFPDLEIIVDRCMTIPDTIEATFSARRYDFAFVHIDTQPMYTKRIHLWEQKLVWIVGKKLYEEYGASQDIYAYPLIGYGSFTEYYPLLRNVVDLDRFATKFCFNDSESIIEAVRQNYGIAVVPSIKIKRDKAYGDIVELAENYAVTLPVNVLYDLEMNMTPPKRLFLELLAANKDS